MSTGCLVSLLMLFAAVDESWVKAEPPPRAEAKKIAASSNALGFDLYHQLGSGRDNLVFSPLSISTALAMTWCGSKLTTEKQLKKTLHAPASCSALARPWGRLAQSLQDPSKPFKLRIASRLFGEQSYAFEKSYLDLTSQAFFTPLEPVDFKQAAEASRRRVNQWVEQQTQQRIKELLPPESVNASTRLALVNAIYFLGYWQEQFDQALTQPADFATSSGVKKLVPTMHQQTMYRVAQSAGVRLIELPYHGGEVAMLIALPDKVDGLPALEKSLTSSKLDRWIAALGRPQLVELTLPSFTLEPAAGLDLVGPLTKLGLGDAFDGSRADFTAMANPADPGERLFLSAALHQAFIKVDEQGTEAAAATALLAECEGMAPPPKKILFHVDHPFVFFIVHRPSGLVLFMGRVVDPSIGS